MKNNLFWNVNVLHPDRNLLTFWSKLLCPCSVLEIDVVGWSETSVKFVPDCTLSHPMRCIVNGPRYGRLISDIRTPWRVWCCWWGLASSPENLCNHASGSHPLFAWKAERSVVRVVETQIQIRNSFCMAWYCLNIKSLDLVVNFFSVIDFHILNFVASLFPLNVDSYPSGTEIKIL